MRPERWREVERLYQAALERDPAERAAFLTNACGTDDALRREVESLLEYHPKAKDFIETPAHLAHLPHVADMARALEPSSVPGRFAGRRFGVYELQALIGAGGMGEVYRAVDTRLNRTVAIKTLPEHLSNDPERRERLEREAKAVSSLNHPHICTLYDVGTEEGVDYLVMEYIEGETLESRLRRGLLPLSQILEHAVQMCDALAKAHERGVVHGDLKPANVMLTKSGLKLLDFGLAARAMSTGGLPVENAALDSADEPTLPRTVMGTLPYMAPEQLDGKHADVRTDLFAFGAVVYEMITGQRAFKAASQVQLIGAILKDDPQPLTELVPDVPVSLARTVGRCLSKDPADRWQTANDLLFHLRDTASPPAAIDIGEPPRRRLLRRVERAAWIAAVLGSIAGVFLWSRSREARTADPVAGAIPIAFTFLPAEGTAFSSGYDVPFAISPDGRYFVYVGVKTDGSRQLWLRPLSSELAQPMPGTDGANTPFWSPDSQWLGFFAGHRLNKIRVSGGPPQIVASNVSTYGGATWGARDVIVFPSDVHGLARVSAQGGPISTLTEAAGGLFWPQFLKDGNHVIYAYDPIRDAQAAPRQGPADGTSSGIYVRSLGNEAPRLLMESPAGFSTVALVPGYIFFVQDAALFARRFDENRYELAGEPVRLLDGIPITGPGRAPFSVSAAGVLAYWSYGVGTPAVLQWFQRDGRTSSAIETPAQYFSFALSPNGHDLAFSRVAKDGSTDLWVRDLTRGSESRLTARAVDAQWSPDGAQLVYTAAEGSPPPRLFIKDFAGTHGPSELGKSPVPNFATSWSRDGRYIVSTRTGTTTGSDLWLQRMPNGDGERLPFNTPFNETDGKISADSHWIAYVTDESGDDQVWIASFPSGEIRRQVSTRGGTSPQWGENDREIFYISRDKEMISASVRAEGGNVDIGTPRPLFRVPNLAEFDRLVFATSNPFVVAPDGRRFLIAVRARDPDAPPIRVVVNWPALLSR